MAFDHLREVERGVGVADVVVAVYGAVGGVGGGGERGGVRGRAIRGWVPTRPAEDALEASSAGVVVLHPGGDEAAVDEVAEEEDVPRAAREHRGAKRAMLVDVGQALHHGEGPRPVRGEGVGRVVGELRVRDDGHVDGVATLVADVAARQRGPLARPAGDDEREALAPEHQWQPQRQRQAHTTRLDGVEPTAGAR